MTIYNQKFRDFKTSSNQVAAINRKALTESNAMIV